MLDRAGVKFGVGVQIKGMGVQISAMLSISTMITIVTSDRVSGRISLLLTSRVFDQIHKAVLKRNAKR